MPTKDEIDAAQDSIAIILPRLFRPDKTDMCKLMARGLAYAALEAAEKVREEK